MDERSKVAFFEEKIKKETELALKQGKHSKETEFIKNALSEGLSLDVISKLTGVSIEIITELKSLKSNP